MCFDFGTRAFKSRQLRVRVRTTLKLNWFKIVKSD